MSSLTSETKVNQQGAEYPQGIRTGSLMTQRGRGHLYWDVKAEPSTVQTNELQPLRLAHGDFTEVNLLSSCDHTSNQKAQDLTESSCVPLKRSVSSGPQSSGIV